VPPADRNNGVFISYRRKSGAVLARLVEEVLVNQKYDVFLDVNNKSGGHYDATIEREILGRTHFLLLWTEGALKRKRLEMRHDPLMREIWYALKLRRNIIGIRGIGIDGKLVDWPSRKNLPRDIADLSTFNAMDYSHEYWQQFKGELLFKRLPVRPEEIDEMHRRPSAAPGSKSWTKDRLITEAIAREEAGRRARKRDTENAAGLASALQDAIEEFGKAEELRRRIANNYPEYETKDAHAGCLVELAGCELEQQKRYDLGKIHLLQALEIRGLLADEECPLPQIAALIELYGKLAGAYQIREEQVGASEALRRAVDVLQRSLGRAKSAPDFALLTAPLVDIGNQAWNRGCYESAHWTFEELLRLQLQYREAHDSPDAMRDHCRLLEHVAQLEQSQKEAIQPRARLEKAIELRRRLVKAEALAEDGDQLCNTLEAAAEVAEREADAPAAMWWLLESISGRTKAARESGSLEALDRLTTTLARAIEVVQAIPDFDFSASQFGERVDEWMRLMKSKVDAETRRSSRTTDASLLRDLLGWMRTVQARCIEHTEATGQAGSSKLTGHGGSALGGLGEELARNIAKVLAAVEAKPTTEIPITKTQFKLGLDCIQKLRHDRAGLPRSTEGNEMLRLLSEGGAAIEALQRAIEPGILLGNAERGDAAAESVRHVAAAVRSVRDGSPRQSLYEVTIELDGFLARIDLLRVLPDRLELVEIKPKIAPKDGLRERQGGIRSQWIPYLQDIGFQHQLLRQWVTQHHESLGIPAGTPIVARLLLVDSAGAATRLDVLDRSNFRSTYRNGGTGVRATVEYVGSPVPTTSSLLREIPLDDELAAIQVSAESSVACFKDMGIAKCMSVMRDIVDTSRWPEPSHSLGAACRGCEFRGQVTERSGFARCWYMQDFPPGHVADLVRVSDQQFRKAIETHGLRAMIADVDEGSITAMQLPQWRAAVSGQPKVDRHFAADPLFLMVPEGWAGPVWFLDFETYAYPIPGRVGGNPYELVPFQFEGHRLPNPAAKLVDRTRLDGFLELQDPDPRRLFVDALQSQFGGEGPIFHWHHFERVVLNSIRASLKAEAAAGDDRRIDFIDSLVGADGAGGGRLVDLLQIARAAFHHPSQRGSYSIKSVVPIAWAQPAIRAAFAEGHGATGDPDWYSGDTDPYDGLPAPPRSLLDVLGGESVVSNVMSEDGGRGGVRNGGMALLAYHYARMFEGAQNQEINAQLRRYCRLDSAAMVMVYAMMRDVVKDWPSAAQT